MTQNELVQELKDLGHEYINEARLRRFLDWALRRVTHAENWPQRWVRVPLASFDPELHGQLDAVVGAQGHLRLATLDQLGSVNLGQTGAPQTYYFEGQALKTWPVAGAADNVGVICWTRAIWKNGGAAAASVNDEPLLPRDFSDLIVLESRLHCLEDTDEDGLRDALEMRGVTELARLKDLHLNPNADEPDSIEIRTGGYA